MTVVEAPDASSYELVITDPDGNETIVEILPEDFANGSFPYTFENLQPGTNYEVGLRYKNPAGETMDAEPVMATTPGISLFFNICLLGPISVFSYDYHSRTQYEIVN